MKHHNRRKLLEKTRSEDNNLIKPKTKWGIKKMIMVFIFFAACFIDCFILFQFHRKNRIISTTDQQHGSQENFLLSNHPFLIKSRSNVSAKIWASEENDFLSNTTQLNKTNNNNATIITHGDEKIILPPRFYISSNDEFYNISSDGQNIWDNATNIPKWVKQYLNWRKYKVNELQTNRNWPFGGNARLLVMECIKRVDVRCGGTADRLKPILFILHVAYRSRRVLFIHWTKPYKLEEFLVPPKGGVDWRLPKWMEPYLYDNSFGFIKSEQTTPSSGITNFSITDLPLVRSKYQSYNGGAILFDKYFENTTEPTFAKLYSAVWKLFFRPSKPIEAMIYNQLEDLQLYPNHYVSAHLRALYNREYRPDDQSKAWAVNAINCATMLRPGYKIYFASDSINCTKYAVQYTNNNNLTVAWRAYHDNDSNSPLHLERSNFRKHKPSDYYDTFVDLYILALGQCVTYNKGGYGHWAMLIGGNVSCTIRQDAMDHPKIRRPCTLTVSNTTTKNNNINPPPTTKPLPKLFLDPID